MSDKPHIVIVARGGAFWLGGRQYSLNLLRALDAVRGKSDAFDISVLVRDQAECEYFERLQPRLRVLLPLDRCQPDRTIQNRARWKIKRTLGAWTNPRLEEQLVRMGATFAYPVTSRVVPSADWISDFQYDHFPELMRETEITDRRAEFSAIAGGAARIVLSSAYAERDCHRIFPQTVGRTTVLRFRAFADQQWIEPEPSETVKKYHLPEQFFLVSNWLLPTKNHLLVLEALARIPQAIRQKSHVVFTGDIKDDRNPGFYNAFLSHIHTLGLRHSASILGVIPKGEQIQLLRACQAYLTPSLSEGWNTGVEEAHLFGKPIVLSDIEVHREQAPLNATYFNPHDASALAEKLAGFARHGPAQSHNLATVRPSEARAFASYSKHQNAFATGFLDLCMKTRSSQPAPAKV